MEGLDAKRVSGPRLALRLAGVTAKRCIEPTLTEQEV
jgi:hypothetical protein